MAASLLDVILLTPGPRGRMGLPTIYWSAPGVGKTAMIEQGAKRYGLPLETLILSIREPSDIAGLPVVTKDGVKLETGFAAFIRRFPDHLLKVPADDAAEVGEARVGGALPHAGERLRTLARDEISGPIVGKALFTVCACRRRAVAFLEEFEDPPAEEPQPEPPKDQELERRPLDRRPRPRGR